MNTMIVLAIEALLAVVKEAWTPTLVAPLKLKQWLYNASIADAILDRFLSGAHGMDLDRY